MLKGLLIDTNLLLTLHLKHSNVLSICKVHALYGEYFYGEPSPHVLKHERPGLILNVRGRLLILPSIPPNQQVVAHILA